MSFASSPALPGAESTAGVGLFMTIFWKQPLAVVHGGRPYCFR
jgi:hypothetical protein